jgi:hypothetical protein
MIPSQQDDIPSRSEDKDGVIAAVVEVDSVFPKVNGFEDLRNRIIRKPSKASEDGQYNNFVLRKGGLFNKVMKH